MAEKLFSIQDLLRERLLGQQITHWWEGWGKEPVTIVDLDVLSLEKREMTKPFLGTLRLCVENIHGRRQIKEVRFDDCLWFVEEEKNG